jgi:hypothetical protein
MQQCSNLRHCTAYRPPLSLLCTLSTLLSPNSSKVVSATAMTELLTLEPNILFNGSIKRESPHYKMKRHRSAPGLCLFGMRSVSVTQNGCAVCVAA